jgi:hypothetical protein
MPRCSCQMKGIAELDHIIITAFKAAFPVLRAIPVFGFLGAGSDLGKELAMQVEVQDAGFVLAVHG